MDEQNETRVDLAAPIGHPLPVLQPTISTVDVEAWAHNYGQSWGRDYSDSPPAPSQWKIERLERLGDGHPSSQHVVGMASVEGDPSDDVLVVYDTNFQAQMWRLTRSRAEQMWPDLLQHAIANAPKAEPSASRPWWKFWA